jgi:hypothetical protein
MDQASKYKDTDGPVIWPSVDDAKPDEEGGPTARVGFNYQDEIAVSFFIEMLEDPTVLKVHCETHDDSVVIRQEGASEKRIAEFIQVKASEKDKLWSVADLCASKNGKMGTSIFEISLGRDKHEEVARFRIVTLRPVVSALAPLTHPFGSPSRDFATCEMTALCADIDERFPGIRSPKSNGTKYWLGNCHWDQRHDEEAVRKDNLLRLIRLSVKDGYPLLFEAAETLLLDLRAMAKETGDAKWYPDRDKKIVTRGALRSWWEHRIKAVHDGAAGISGGKLVKKMAEAGLPEEVINLAVDLRLGYAAASRTSRYLAPEEAERLRLRVQSEVMSLRARLVAGQLTLSGSQFHALCVDRMDAVNAERVSTVDDRSAFLKGCMYDIADRCLLRFAARSS